VGVGFLATQLFRRLEIEDPAIVITLTVLTPFAAYLPAQAVGASGVLVAQAYGENLVFTRRYTARLGESRFRIHDVVENAGHLPVEHMLLYHMNIGFPSVDEGAELLAPFGEVPGTVAGSSQDGLRGVYGKYIAPQRDWVYEGYEHNMLADAEGNVRVAIANPHLRGGLGVYVVYRREQLPRYIEWRTMGEGHYVVGIEPCTNLFGREAVRQAGDLIVLQPGEKREYDLEVGVLIGAEEIARYRARVQDVRATATG
jgi:hypothetical protein